VPKCKYWFSYLHKQGYLQIRTHSDLTPWLKFFLEGIRQTAESAIQTFRSIISLREECERSILTLGKKSQLARNALHLLFSQPIVGGPDIATAFSIDSLDSILALLFQF
jgi:Fic family protein